MSAPSADASAAAAQSLRDTAKWMVAGVAGAAAGVLAGSSLTSFGALEPGSHRFDLALAGFVAGLLCLGGILFAAIKVLTRDFVFFNEIAQAGAGYDKLRTDLESKFASRFTPEHPDLATYLDEVRTVANKPVRSDADDAFLAAAARDRVLFASYAGFWVVRNQFGALVRAIRIYGVGLAVSVGAFAWAANPPKPAAAPAQAPTVTVNAPTPQVTVQVPPAPPPPITIEVPPAPPAPVTIQIRGASARKLIR